MTKKLSILLKGLEIFKTYGSKNIEVTGIKDDSRKVISGNIFVAIYGQRYNSHKFINDVIEKGASVVVGEIKPQQRWLTKITYIKVTNSRRALGLLASAWYEYPSKRLKILGVTGTDGKTTTASIIYWLLKNSGKKVGLISTINAKIGDREYDTGFHVTNPEPLLLQNFLAKMVEAEFEYAILEVTSHGLDQERVAGIDFDIGVLTNITQEHLDYHKTWLDYFNTKAKLFKKVKFAVLNKDDSVVYEDIKCVVPSSAEVITYGIRDESADYYGEDILERSYGTEFDIVNRKKAHHFKIKLLGDYNVSNILASCAVARACNIGWEKISLAASSFKSPRGRLEEVKNNKGFKVFVDFAHTPNALENVLSYLAKRKKRRLITVFGCAGERDVGKRVQMGEISGRLADFTIFTAEDPRGENVSDIIKEMVKGVKMLSTKKADFSNFYELIHKSKNHIYFEIPERGEAITFAIQKLAKKGDRVIICGKGHEKSMAYNGIEYPWSDQEAVKMALEGEVMRIKRK